MIDAYAQLSGVVKELTGNKLYVSSDLRTREEQEALYREDPATATIPGASEHQSGLALDVYVAYYAGDAFLKSPSGRFVNTHAHHYGFIIRYPAYGEEITGIRFEPWHIRYVGAPHARVIYNNQLTLEEYILSFEVG
jgi:D-alanyl-D-alanine carboxypeptidase